MTSPIYTVTLGQLFLHPSSEWLYLEKVSPPMQLSIIGSLYNMVKCRILCSMSLLCVFQCLDYDMHWDTIGTPELKQLCDLT